MTSAGCIRHLLSVFIVVATMIPAAAYSRDYEIELIIFQNAKGDQYEGERWSMQSSARQENETRIQSLVGRADTVASSSQLSRLDGVRSNLARSGHRILRTIRWRQPSAVYQNAPLVALGVPGSPLDLGFIRIYKTSLIFADIDLKVRLERIGLPQPVSSELTQTAELSSNPSLNSVENTLQPAPVARIQDFFLSEKRRLKFKEVHYFDHPLFGAILGVWPSE
ncbi:MAG: CsiV family protein [Pseudomonadota bacterium]